MNKFELTLIYSNTVYAYRYPAVDLSDVPEIVAFHTQDAKQKGMELYYEATNGIIAFGKPLAMAV